MVEPLKARLRICSIYSRLAIKRILRICFASHRLDEYLLKRGLNQFVPVNGRHGRGLVKQLLCVAVLLQPDFGVAGEVLCFSNLRRIEKGRTSVELDNDAVAFIP